MKKYLKDCFVSLMYACGLIAFICVFIGNVFHISVNNILYSLLSGSVVCVPFTVWLFGKKLSDINIWLRRIVAMYISGMIYATFVFIFKVLPFSPETYLRLLVFGLAIGIPLGVVLLIITDAIEKKSQKDALREINKKLESENKEQQADVDKNTHG